MTINSGRVNKKKNNKNIDNKWAKNELLDYVNWSNTSIRCSKTILLINDVKGNKNVLRKIVVRDSMT